MKRGVKESLTPKNIIQLSPEKEEPRTTGSGGKKGGPVSNRKFKGQRGKK